MFIVYKDGKILTQTDSKRSAFKEIRNSYTPEAKYIIGEGSELEKLSVTKRADGRITINYLSAIAEWLEGAKKEGSQRTVSVVMSSADYSRIEAAAAKKGMSVWSWAKTVLIEASKKI